MKTGVRPTSSPGVSRSTRKEACSSLAHASTIKNPARSPPVTNHFSPSRTHSSPSLLAVVFMSFMSEPAPGSVIAQASRVSPRKTGMTYRSTCSGLASSNNSRGPLSATMYPRPLVTFPDSSSSATSEAMDRSMPPYSVGMLRLLNPAARALVRNARSFSSSIFPRSAISASNGWSSSLTNLAMRTFNAFTSSGISAVICSAVVTDLSPLLLFGEGEGDRVLNPVRVPLPREPRKLYVLLGQVFDLAVTDEPGHLFPERRPPHHPVPPCGQDVETLYRLVDDGEVVRRVVDGRRPRPRYRQCPERRVCRLPVRTQPLVVVPVEVDLVASRLISIIDRVAHAKQNTLLLGPPVVTLAYVEHQRERMLGPLGHVRESDDLVPHSHHGNLHPDHAADIPRPPRPSSVHYPLCLEIAARTLDRVVIALLADARHLAHLEQVDRIVEEHRTGGIAGRHRRMDVPVVRRVCGPREAVPVQIGKAPSALLGLYPLVLDPRCPPHLDQPQETFLLLLRLSNDVVPRFPKTGVQA